MELDPVRLQLIRLLEVKDTNMRAASVAIGMNPAYLHQFIFRGTPKVLPRKIRSLLAKHLGVEEKVLTHAILGPKLIPPLVHAATMRASLSAVTTLWKFMKSMCAHRQVPARSMRGWRTRQRRGCSRKPLCGMNCVRRPSTCA